MGFRPDPKHFIVNFEQNIVKYAENMGGGGRGGVCGGEGGMYSEECNIYINYVNKIKQVAQRATIAHLSPMCQHPLISNKPASKVIKNLNSFQIREQLFFQGLVPPMSAV